MKKTGTAFVLACLQILTRAQKESEDTEDSIADTLLLAILDPSAEYLHIYIGFVLALLIIVIGTKAISSKKGKSFDSGDFNPEAKKSARANA